jgi:hypothetical protein
MSRKRVTTFFFLACALALVGCTRLSPTVIQASASDYNVAIQRVTDEQLLLNLVRLRYRDPPYFMQVTSLSSQFRLNESFNAGASLRGVITDTLLSDSATTDRAGSLGASITSRKNPRSPSARFTATSSCSVF